MDPTVCFPGKLGVLRGSVLFRPKTTEIKHTEDGKPHSLRHRVSIVPKPGTLRRIPETAWGRREGWHRQRSLDKRATFRTAVCQTNRRLDAYPYIFVCTMQRFQNQSWRAFTGWVGGLEQSKPTCWFVRSFFSISSYNCCRLQCHEQAGGHPASTTSIRRVGENRERLRAFAETRRSEEPALYREELRRSS